MKATKPVVRTLGEICEDIRKDWQKMHFGAIPYFQAMKSLNSVTDTYGMDSGKIIVLYFLSNASTWKGETAKRIKLELKEMCK